MAQGPRNRPLPLPSAGEEADQIRGTSPPWPVEGLWRGTREEEQLGAR